MTITKTTISLTIGLLIAFTIAGCATNEAKENKQKAAGYYSKLGAGYLQKGRLDLSKGYLEKALASAPQSSDAHHYYALLQEKLGDDEKADQHFNLAIKTSKRQTPNPELMNNYGSYLCRVGQYGKALAAFNMALRDPLYSTKEFALSNAGICLKKKGDIQQAEEYLTQALNQNPNFALALYHSAEINYQQGNNAKAQAYLYRYNEHSPDTPETLLLCYKISTALQETVQAEKCSAQLRARFPRSTEVHQLN